MHCESSIRFPPHICTPPPLVPYNPVSLSCTHRWVFYGTYQRFSARSGLSSNLDARLHILAANAINVIVFLVYWSVFVIPYIITYEVPSPFTHACTIHSYVFDPQLDDHFNPWVRTAYWIVQFHYPCKV